MGSPLGTPLVRMVQLRRRRPMRTRCLRKVSRPTAASHRLSRLRVGRRSPFQRAEQKRQLGGTKPSKLRNLRRRNNRSLQKKLRRSLWTKKVRRRPSSPLGNAFIGKVQLRRRWLIRTRCLRKVTRPTAASHRVSRLRVGRRRRLQRAEQKRQLGRKRKGKTLPCRRPRRRTGPRQRRSMRRLWFRIVSRPTAASHRLSRLRVGRRRRLPKAKKQNQL